MRMNIYDGPRHGRARDVEVGPVLEGGVIFAVRYKLGIGQVVKAAMTRNVLMPIKVFNSGEAIITMLATPFAALSIPLTCPSRFLFKTVRRE